MAFACRCCAVRGCSIQCMKSTQRQQAKCTAVCIEVQRRQLFRRIAPATAADARLDEACEAPTSYCEREPCPATPSRGQPHPAAPSHASHTQLHRPERAPSRGQLRRAMPATPSYAKPRPATPSCAKPRPAMPSCAKPHPAAPSHVKLEPYCRWLLSTTSCPISS